LNLDVSGEEVEGQRLRTGIDEADRLLGLDEGTEIEEVKGKLGE